MWLLKTHSKKRTWIDISCPGPTCTRRSRNLYRWRIASESHHYVGVCRGCYSSCWRTAYLLEDVYPIWRAPSTTSAVSRNSMMIAPSLIIDVGSFLNRAEKRRVKISVVQAWPRVLTTVGSRTGADCLVEAIDGCSLPEIFIVFFFASKRFGYQGFCMLLRRHIRWLIAAR